MKKQILLLIALLISCMSLAQLSPYPIPRDLKLGGNVRLGTGSSSGSQTGNGTIEYYKPGNYFRFYQNGSWMRFDTITGGGITTTLPWDSITGKPPTYPATTHTHSYGSLSGIPPTFAPAAHNQDWTTITNRPTNLNQFTNGPGFITSEVDGSVTNEIQALSIDGDQLTIIGGNTVTIPSGENLYADYLKYIMDSTFVPGTPGQIGDSVTMTKYTLPTYSGTVYYIDPSQPTQGNGTIESPYNTWAGIVFQENCSYLQKFGTTYTQNGTITPGAGGIAFSVKLGAYGDSTLAKPIIQINNTDPVVLFSGNGTYLIRDLNLRAARMGMALRQNGTGTLWIYKCDLQGGDMTFYKYNNGATGGTVKMLYTSVHDSYQDNVYCDDVRDIEIGHCSFYDVNLSYFDFPGNDNPGGATGDNVQLATAFGSLSFNIHHSVFDHTGTGHKFNLIVWNGFLPTDAAWCDMNGTISDNIFIGCESEGWLDNFSNIYICDIADGDKVTLRRNIIYDGSNGVFMESANVDMQYNLFYLHNNSVNLSQAGADLIAHNNTFADYGTVAIAAVSSTTATTRNNIFSPRTTAPAYNTNASYNSDYNLFQGNVASGQNLTQWVNGTTNDDHSLSGDPLFQSPGAPNRNYRLNTGSPALNAGIDMSYTTDLSLDDVTNPPSMGCYENIVAPTGNFIPGTPDTTIVDSALIAEDIYMLFGNRNSKYAAFKDGDLYFYNGADLKLDWRSVPLADGIYSEVQFNTNGLLDTDTLFQYKRDSTLLVVNKIRTGEIEFFDGTTQTSASSGGSGGVSSIIAGTGISINPSNGLGDVTITATGGAGTADSLFIKSQVTELWTPYPTATSVRTLWRPGTASLFLAPSTAATYTGSNSTVVGHEAGNSLTTVTGTSAFGYQALYSKTSSGQECSAFGTEALRSTSSGRANNGFGYRALYNTTTGGFNCAFGTNAGASSATISYSALFGNETAQNLGASIGVTAIGYYALRSSTSTTASYSTALGYQSGMTTTASDCLYLGVQAGNANATNDKLFIGNRNNNFFIEGSFADKQLYVKGNFKSESKVLADELTTIPIGDANTYITGSYETPPSSITLTNVVVGSYYTIVCGTSTKHITIPNSGNWVLNSTLGNWTPNSRGDNLVVYILSASEYIEISRNDVR